MLLALPFNSKILILLKSNHYLLLIKQPFLHPFPYCLKIFDISPIKEKNSSRGLLRMTKFTNKKRHERVKLSSLIFFFAIYGSVIKAGDNYSFGSHFYSKCVR